MARKFKNVDWDLADDEGKIPTWQHVSIAVQMDIRDELQKLNRVFECSNFLAIPAVLRDIKANTKKRIPKSKEAK